MSENNYGAMMIKSAVGVSDDINEILSPGIYLIPPANTSSPDSGGGALIIHSGSPIRRTFTSDSVICLTSTRNGNAWTGWRGPLSRTNPFADIKADGAAAIAEAFSNLGLGSAATKDVGTGTGQIPDMSSFSSVASYD
ncbi:pyocin knob domain-containing protein, partial [Citrobacter portucalensis]|nr:pyocin knob domain-containing protein [Citrobacter portucalensis]